MSDPKPPAQGVNVGTFLRRPDLPSEPRQTARIPARLSFVTLAVRDFGRMAKFYRQFGWPESKDSNDDFVAFQAGGAILGLFHCSRSRTTSPSAAAPSRSSIPRTTLGRSSGKVEPRSTRAAA